LIRFFWSLVLVCRAKSGVGVECLLARSYVIHPFLVKIY